MKNVLIINCHAEFPNSKGLLNKTIVEEMGSTLSQSGKYSLVNTTIGENYDLNQEIEKFKAADIIIWQFPLYFTSLPGTAKVYLDNVFTYGNFFTMGEKPLAGKEYMLSVTTGMPGFLFNNPESPYQGKSLDEVLYSVHSAEQSVGLQPLKTFSVHGVSPELNIEEVKAAVALHMKEVFGL